jgi:hypothetical protein
MENRKGPPASEPARNRPTSQTIFHFPVSIFLLSILLGGCAAPAEPLERRAPVPKAVTDLVVVQAGNDVVLRFTLPKETVDQRPLKQLPAIEIYRAIRPASSTTPAAPSSPAPRLILTIPSAMVDQYSDQGHIRAVDSLKSEDFQPDQEEVAEYVVRTRASAKKESTDSNSILLRIYPTANPITDLKVEITHSGILLTWTPPEKTLVGSAPTIAKYHVYRSELNTVGTTAANGAEKTKQKTPLLEIGESEAATYRDTLAELGKTYVYSVRSVAEYPKGAIESGDSNLASVTANGTLPPAAPQGLVVVFVPRVGELPVHMDLSWAINSETDIAGYNVYRSEQDGAPGTRLNPELLLTPAFRDMNAVPGRRYLYAVTAVDRSGNESPASAAAPGGVPAENQLAP